MIERMSLAVSGVLAGEPTHLRLAGPSLIVTLEASTIEVALPAKTFIVDRTCFLVAPTRASTMLRSPTSSNRVAVLGVHGVLIGAVEREYKKLGLSRARLEAWLSRPALLPRTAWVHEVVHRYVFEREALGAHDNRTTRFLEIELLKEIYFLFRDREDEGADRQTLAQRHSPPVQKALAYIEANLFERRTLDALAVHAGASESTLLRSFRRELGCTPGAYWRSRCLDEALVVLRSGRYSVAEVATRAGYENPTSFAYAFRRRFGRSPTTLRPKRPTKRAP
jgi:AraC-like DNA-binding protein